MRRWCALAALGVLAGCGPNVPEDSVWLVMCNETGQHMTNFVLRYGTGRFDYQIFSRGYTFAGWAYIREEQPVAVEYTDEAGAAHAVTLKRPLTREMIGGSYRVTFKPGDVIEQEMSWPK